jgi:general secretion pathway protein A
LIYNSFFGLNEEPFGVTPDPNFLYISTNHEEAIAHLSHGIAQNRGFIMLTGEVGSGKTTLIRHVFQNFDPKVRTAMVLNPKMNALELLKFINHDFGLGVKHSSTHKELMDGLNSFLLERYKQGETAVLAIDEAQEMSAECLEFVRLLSNLETDTNKLIQIILVGQPELKDIVNSARLKQLNHRISVRFHLDPLALEETARYIRHRLKVAGSDTITFPEKGITTIHDLSHGIPRLINLLCDRVLLAAYGNGELQIRTRLIKEVAKEFGKEDIAPPEMRTEKRIEKPAEKGRKISLRPAFAGLALFTLFALFIYGGVEKKQITSSADSTDSASSAKDDSPGAGIFMADGIYMAPDTALSEEACLMNLLQIWGEEGLDGATSGEALKSGGYSVYSFTDMAGITKFKMPVVLELAEASPARHVTLKTVIGEYALILDPLEGKHLVSFDDLKNRAVDAQLIYKKNAASDYSGQTDEETLALLSKGPTNPSLAP